MTLHIGDAMIRLILDQKELIQGMNQAKQITEQSTADMQKAWMKVGLAYGVVGTAGAVLMKQIAGTAMRTQELGIVLGVVASNAGVTAETTAQLEAEMKDLGMTTQAARTIITRMIQTNVDLSKATDLVRVAQDMAVISMEDSSTAAQGLMRAIVTMNPILLRKYGIMTGLEDIDRRAGEALGILSYETEKSGKVVKKWTRDITAAERQQAIFNMILEEGGKFAGTYAGAMEAPGKAMRSFSRYIMEAQEAIGQYWLPVMNAAVGAATSFIKAFIDAPEIVHQLAGALLVATTVVAGITAAIIAKTIAMTALTAAFGAATITLGAFTVSLAVATAGLTLILAAIVLLVIKLKEQSQATMEAQTEALELSVTYKMYVTRMKSAGEEAHILTEEIWKLTRAEIANAGATGESADAIAARAVERLKAIDILEHHIELQEQITATSAGLLQLEYLQSKALADVAIKAALLDQEYMDLLQSMGLVTQEMITAVWAAESLAAGTGVLTRELQEQDVALDGYTQSLTRLVEEATTVWDRLSKETSSYWDIAVASAEDGVISMRAAFYDIVEEAKLYGEAMESTFVETTLIAAQKTKEMLENLQSGMETMGNIVADGYVRMSTSTENYHSAVVKMEEDFSRQIESATLQRSIAQQQTEEKYQRSRLEAVAKYEADAAALAAAGETERLADLTQAHEQKLAEMEYAHAKQIAESEQAEAIQTHLAQVAQAQRLYDAAKANYDALVELQQFIGTKLLMWVELHKQELEIAGISSATLLKMIGDLFGAELSLANQFNVEWQKLMKAWAEGNIDAAEASILAIKGFGEALQGEIDAAEGSVAAARAALDAIVAGWAPPALELPTMPDWGQWTSDFTSSASSAAKKTKESVVKTLKETMIDIADGFAAAMAIFEEVAEYETPIGLAEGMDALREDIEMAVEHLYQAYETVGKKGVERAQLFAESALAVVSMIGDAVEAFGLLKDYGSVMTSDIDKFIDDLEYLLVAIRTRLLDLWGWSGARADTVWGHLVSWAEAVSAVMGVIGYAVETFNLLRKYKGLMPTAIDNLIEDIELVLNKLAEIAPLFETKGLDATLEFAIATGAIMENITKAIQPLLNLADFAPDQATMRAGIDNFFASLEYFLDEFAWGMWRWEDLASEKTVEIAARMGQIMSGIGEAIQPLLNIAEYAPDQASFRSAVSLFFANLEYFLDEFAWGMWRWEDLASEKSVEIAGLIGQTLGGLGEAIQPLLDVADYSITPGEAERAAQLFFQSLEIFLDTFAWQAEKFEAKIDPALTALAESIGALVSGIGAAVGPLMELAQYGIVEFEYGGVTFKTLLNLSEVQKSFDLFFQHLGMILDDFEEASKEWEVSKAAQALAAAIGELASSLSTALQFLNDVAVYGAETADSAARGFQTFLRDIRRILSDLEEANETMGPALAAAEEFALATADVLSAIQEGINDLNSLGELEEMPDLVKAGISLIKSLEDGMLAQVDEAILTAVGAVKSIVDAIILNCDHVWKPQLFTAGIGLGSTLISGMIAGLIAQEGALYSTIASIIQSAIAAANAAAGAVPAGLGGLGGMATPMAVPEFATPAVGAGALGAGPHYHYELEYHAHRAEVGEEDAARAMKLIEFRNRWK